MNTPSRSLIKKIICLVLPLVCVHVQAQQDTTVSYPVSYFSQWNPVTVADMIDRIPGISIALEGSGGSNRNQNNRGLGNAENILINGRRISGKDNEARDQLTRINADQVSRIDIIRGTSSDLQGVRNEGQIINIVTATNSQMSVTLAGNVRRYQDDHTEPGGSIQVNGNTTSLEYRLSLEQQSQYQVIDSNEESIHGVGDFSPNDIRTTREITDQVNSVVNGNLSYRLSPRQNLSVNLLYEESDPPRFVDRTILDFNFQPPAVFREQERVAATRDAWELGADYTVGFADDSQLNLLSINNQRDQDTLRERFRLDDNGGALQDLSLRNDTVNKERIYRGVYTRPLTTGHDLELGLERAQTILETDLALSRLGPGGELVSVNLPNARSEIEEIRYEGFAVHHWQLNPRMKLESTLLYEVSEISQTGDVNRSRDFDFVRPKVDYRFNITPELQLQFSIEKFVAQLSFADFAANTDPRDEDRDTVAGNPDLRQQQSWRYTANLEYRFLEGRGVVNARAWYWDVSDAIGRIDVSEPGGPLASANGNIGDGEVKAFQINSSFRITPNLLLSGTVMARASEVIDPFAGIARRLVPNDRGFHSFNLRHDLPRWSLNYGIDYFGAPQGNRPLFDINRIDHIDNREDLSLFVERNSIGPLGLVARVELRNVLDRGICSDRFRFDDRLSVGSIAEIERRCDERGSEYVFELRGTF
ncbi:MAG: TonB-dependent receptor plug domain-containing protein [Pseudohongiellaceae bacterium]